jgi:DNA transposition AAA+ family ATPase
MSESQKPNLGPANEQLRSRLRLLRASNPLLYSNAELGKKLGYSSSALSQYLNDGGNKYDGNVEKLERNAADMLRAMDRRRASGVETTDSHVAKKVLEGYEYIRKTNDLGGIIADSGKGKSRGIELILKKHSVTILIEVTEWCCDKHAIMRQLWDKCGVSGWNRTTPQFPFLVSEMTGSDRPFIFDDAHKLSRPALSLVATFQEKTGCPIALVGMAELVKKLEDDPQRFSRAGLCYAIKSDKKEDNDLIVHMIRCIAKTVNGELEDLVDLCKVVAAHQGCYRAVQKQLKVAAEFHHADDSKPWTKCFREAHNLLLRPYQLPSE